MTSYREERAGSIFRKEIGEIIEKDMSDPRVQGLITITRVKVDMDIKRLRVYVSILEEDRGVRRRVMRGIQNGKGYIKKRLGENLRLKYIPEIFFREEKNQWEDEGHF